MGAESERGALQAEAGLQHGLEMLQHSLEADHHILGAALREHGRYVVVARGALRPFIRTFVPWQRQTF